MAGPQNARSGGGGGGRRYYVWGRGERYWSVTTILRALPKDALKFWAAKKVAEFAFDQAHAWLSLPREAAVDLLKREPLRFTGGRADVGSAFHEIAESYTLGRPLSAAPFDPEIRTMVGHFLAFLDAFKPRYVATELSVYNRTQRYAGTADGIIEIGAEVLERFPTPWEPPEGRDFARILIDYKTGRGVYPEAGLQLNAYGHAEFAGLPNGEEQPLPELDGAAIVHVTEDGWELVPVRLSDELFASFLYVREVFRFLEVLSKECLGTPLTVAPVPVGGRQ